MAHQLMEGWPRESQTRQNRFARNAGTDATDDCSGWSLMVFHQFGTTTNRLAIVAVPIASQCGAVYTKKILARLFCVGIFSGHQSSHRGSY